MYMDAIDSILNIRKDIKLVVGDGRVTDSIRFEMKKHHLLSDAAYDIMMYEEPQSQWKIFNDIISTYVTEETRSFIYGPRDLDPVPPPFQTAARAPVLNAYVMIFRMDFLRTYGGYPTIFRNCFSESFLAYMCEAMGGEMRIMPRGHVFHYGEGDKWTTPGSAYYYTEEKLDFQGIMDNVLMHKAMRTMTVAYLKNKLYKK